jgi:polyphenol oxidase
MPLERLTLGSGIAALVSPELRTRGFLVAFTERGGGVSEPPFRSLNLGLRSGDDPRNVVRNRRMVCDALHVSSFACGEQVHGPKTAVVGRGDEKAGFRDAEDSIPGVDALVTTASGVALCVLTADCAPIALVDPDTGTIGVVHAGWRGTAAGIVPSALERFQDVARVHAVIGPTVGADHYRVQEDVAEAVSAASGSGARLARVPGGFRLDLGGTIAAILAENGVRRVEREDACTACEEDRYFSYRRDGRTGRQALIAVRMR